MITQFTVGQNKNFLSIQEAINYLAGAGTFTTPVELIVYEGVHGGFIVEPNSLGTSSTNRLTIKAAPNNNVVLNGNNLSQLNGHGFKTVGIGIGDNNRYIKIKGLKVEKFHKGLVVAGNSEYIDILSNIFNQNLNVNVWIYRSNYCTVLNNILLDANFNLVCSEVDDVFIAFNDIIKYITIPGDPTSSSTLVHLTTTIPSSSAPPGSIGLYCNNIASNGTTLIGYDNNALLKLRSKKNNLYNPNGNIASIVNSASPVPDAASLASWQAISSNDLDSISVTPLHYVAQSIGNSSFTSIFLDNFPYFNGVGNGLALCNYPTASTATSNVPYGTLPSYVDTSYLCETVQSNFTVTAQQRPTVPSIGAFDGNYDQQGFGSTLAPVGLLGSGVNSSECIPGSGAGLSIIDEKYSQSIECINPSVRAGFFYVHDILYYLYSAKYSSYIKDIMYCEIVIATRPLSEDLKIYIDDTEIDKENFVIHDNKLLIKLNDYLDHDSTIKIDCYTLKWYTDRFEKERFIQELRIKDGVIKYLLEHAPTQAAPVVITDDKVNYADKPERVYREFKLFNNTEYNLTEVVFNGPINKIINSQFDYSDTEKTGSFPVSYNSGTLYYPRNWEVKTGRAGITPIHIASLTGTTELVVDSVYTGNQYPEDEYGIKNLYPYIGSNFCVFSGTIAQRVRIDENSSYWISFYAAAIKDPNSFNTYPHVTGNLITTFYNIDMVRLSTSFTGSVALFSDYTEDNLWHRQSLKIHALSDTTVGKTGAVTGNVIPSNAYYMEVSLQCNDYMAIDAVCLHLSEDLQSYNRMLLGEEGTIEYETGLTELYNITDLTITPARNKNNNGFLFIEPIPSSQFDTGAPINTNTLTDWAWPRGRVEFLPWARLGDKNKYINRGTFNINTQNRNSLVTIAPPIAYPEDIEIYPRVLSANYITLDKIANGITTIGVDGADFTVKVHDTNGNPYAFGWIDVSLNGGNADPYTISEVGLIGSRELGFFREFSTSLSAQLDSYGSTTLRWIPPEYSLIMKEVTSITEVTSEDGEYYISNFNNIINESNHGNCFLSTPQQPNGLVLTNTLYSETLGISNSIINNNVLHKVYKLSRTPDRETIKVYTDSAKTGVVFIQSEIPELSDGQYHVDEHSKLLFLNSSYNSTIFVEYEVRHTYVKHNIDGVPIGNRLYISEELKDYIDDNVSFNNPLSILYDMRIELIIKARTPYNVFTEYLNDINIREKVLTTALVGKTIPQRLGLSIAE